MKAPDSAGGKRAKCSLCGAVQTIPSADEENLSGIFPDPSGSTMQHPAPPAASMPPPLKPPTNNPSATTTGRHHYEGISTAPQRGFWLDAALSFTIHFRGAGPFLFGFVVLMLIINGILGYAGGFGLAGRIIVSGWICSYLLSIVQETCSGSDELPVFSLTEGMWEEVIRPLLLFIGGSVLVFAPLLVWWLLLLSVGSVLGGLGDLLISVVLLAGGLFLWPMTLLTLAIHGFSMNVLRYDKQLVTIFRAFPAYLAIGLMLAVVAGGTVGSFTATSTIATSLGIKDFATSLLFLIFGTSVFLSYFSLAAMRIIGLFYRHYKRHFVWIAE